MIFKEIIHFHPMTYSHGLAQEPPHRGSFNYSFGRPFLDLHYYTLSLSEQCPRVKKIFLQIHQFYTFYSKIGIWVGGHEFTISCLLTLDLLHTKFG